MDKKICKSIPFKMLSLAGMAALLSFPLGSALADAVSVTSFSPAWLLDPSSASAGTPTWALPEGSETASEQVGHFVINTPFDLGGGAAAAGFWIGILDKAGVDSDIITFTNTGSGGNGEVKFYSDPFDFATLTTKLVADGLTGITGCTEVDPSGCTEPAVTGLLTADPGFTVIVSSDGDVTNPNATGDAIQFTGATVGVLVGVPEPATLGLLGVGLGVMSWFAWRKKRKDAAQPDLGQLQGGDGEEPRQVA